MVGGISNLLAQITGEKPASSPRPSPAVSRPNPVPKRKAEDDLRSSDASKRKSPNPVAQSASAPAPSRPTVAQKPRPADKPSTSLNRQVAASKSGDRPGLPQKSSTASLSKSSPSGPRPNGVSQRPATTASKPGAATDSASKAAPKKGSFAEIMARGQRAQQVMGQVGKIQHKKIEKGPSKKEREELKAGPRAPQSQKGASAIPGTTKPGASSMLSRPGGSLGNHGRASQDKSKAVGKGAGKAEPEQPEKKRKPPMSTGYAGTARPKTTASPSKPKKPAPAGGVVLNSHPQFSRYTGSKRSRYEEDEDDMSDFIDYDDEEDDPRARRYDDESDASSDMEAGLDEIDEEEERAAYIAKKDDMAELQLEKRLKAEKERRKRELMMAARGRR